MAMEVSVDTHRRPAGAVLLSLVLPGLGHLYSGELRTAWRAALLLAVVVLAAVACGAYLPGAALNTAILFGAPIAVWVGVAVSAYRAAKRTADGYQLKPFNRWWVYALVAGLYVLVDQTAYRPFVYSFVARGYRFPSTSMEPTLLAGEYFFVKHTPSSVADLRRGDLVAFNSVTQKTVSIVKRVAGLPTDTLQMRGDTLILNGAPQTEPYTQHIDPHQDPRDPEMMWQATSLVGTVDRLTYSPSRSNWGPIVVPPDHIFALGDNRHNSYDSRYWGFVPARNIRGRALRVYFSYDPDSWRALPFLTAIRWHRLGKALQ